MARGAQDRAGIGGSSACWSSPRMATLTPNSTWLPASLQLQSAHPVPDVRSFSNGAELEERVRSLREDIFPLFLISGGSSSLVEALRDGVSLGEVQALNVQGLASGWDIARLNIARARLSRIKGGGIARLLRERRALALFISDVPGDDPDVIGSGLLGRDAGIADGIERHVIATIESAVRAVQDGAHAHGLISKRCPRALTAMPARSQPSFSRDCAPAKCDGLVWGGESTVTLPRASRARWPQYAPGVELRAAACAPANRWMLLAAGTDGTDGPTGDAGAIVDAGTIERATLGGLRRRTRVARVRFRHRARGRRRSRAHRTHRHECRGSPDRDQTIRDLVTWPTHATLDLIFAPMRLMLIDDDPRYRTLLRHHISCAWPDVDLVSYNPRVRGPLTPGFLAQGYSVVLLDHEWKGRLGPRLAQGFPRSRRIRARYFPVRRRRISRRRRGARHRRVRSHRQDQDQTHQAQ